MVDVFVIVGSSLVDEMKTALFIIPSSYCCVSQSVCLPILILYRRIPQLETERSVLLINKLTLLQIKIWSRVFHCQKSQQ